MNGVEETSRNKIIDTKSGKINSGRSALLVLIIGLYIGLNIATSGELLKVSNMSQIFTSSVINIFMGWSMLFIFTPGITDLSVGAILILAANVGGIFAINFRMGTVGLLLGTFLASALLLLLNTLLRERFNIPSWIFGIGAMMIYEAIGMLYSANMISRGAQVVSLGNIARNISRTPWNIIFVFVSFALAYLLLYKTSIGYNIRALGSNTKVSETMGINIHVTLLQSAIIGSLFLGLAAAFNLSYSNRVIPVLGLASMDLIIHPLAGFLLSNSFSKYINQPLGIAIFIFFISTLFNVLTILGVPSGTWQETVMGLVVLIAAIVSQKNNEGVVK